MNKRLVSLFVCCNLSMSCYANVPSTVPSDCSIALTVVDQPTQLAILAICQKLDRFGLPHPPALKQLFNYFFREEFSVPTSTVNACKQQLEFLILEYGKALGIPSLEVLISVIADHQVAAKSLGVSQ